MLLAGILLGLWAQEPLPLGPYDGLSSTYFRLDADVHAAAIPAGSRVLLALDATGRLTGWERKSGRRLYSRPAVPPADFPQGISCSPDGTLIAISARGSTATLIRVFSVATGDEVHRFDRCLHPVFSPDSRFLAGSDGRQLRRWSLKSGAELPGLHQFDENLGVVAYSPDGKRIAADLLGKGQLAIYHLEFRTVDTLPRRDWRDTNATGLVFTPDGEGFKLGTPWGIEAFRAGDGIPEPGGGPPFFYSTDGTRLVAGFRNKRVSIVEPATGRYLFEHRVPLSSPESLEVSQDADILMRIIGTGIRLEPIIDRSKVATPPRVTALVLLPGGRVRIGDVLGVVREWDLEKRKEIGRFEIPDAAIHSFSADGRRLLTFKEDGAVRVWDASTGAETLKIDTLRTIQVAALSPDAESLAVGLADGTVSLWDVGKGKERARLAGELAISALAWSADGRTIAWGDWHGGIGMAESRSGGDRLERKSRGDMILSMAFSPNGRVLATGDRAGQLRLWSDDVGREPEWVGSASRSLISSPDGRWLATLAGNSVALQSQDGREKTLLFEAFQESLSAIAFSADGSMFVTGGWDGSVLLWRVPPKK